MATRNTYTPQTWKDLPDKETPINAERLEHIENGIKDIADTRALNDIYSDNYMNLQASEHPTVKTTGTGSIVHGSASYATSPFSYSGGVNLANTGAYSHNEGSNNAINAGSSVHVEGNSNTINGSNYAHTEGDSNTIIGSASAHAEGASNRLNGNNPNAHVEGEYNNIYSVGSGSRATHVEGGYNNGRGSYSHLEGYGNEEYVTSNVGQMNHMEGNNNTLYTINGYGAHVEGYSNHAGTSSKMAGSYIHVEGIENYGYGTGSHIEGYTNKEASGNNETNWVNHIEGQDNALSGNNSYVHVSGYHNTSTGSMAGAVYGLYNTLAGNYQFVCGQYSKADPSKAFIVGGGSYQDPKNIYTLDWQGNAVFSGNVQGTYNGEIVSLYDLLTQMKSNYNRLFSGMLHMQAQITELTEKIATLEGTQEEQEGVEEDVSDTDAD